MGSNTGPPGIGKTATVARTVLGVINQDLKFIGVGPQNIAVDGLAMKFWEVLPWDYNTGQTEKMFLRLATKSAEIRAYTAVKNYTNPSISDPNEMQSFTDVPAKNPA